jgi:tryptophanyl-tRNA synthetase
MTQFKEKAGKQRDSAGLGLYSYPVLMAADILLYRGTHVPVGEDQKQHLELARDIAGAFNRQFGVEHFPLPEPQILGEATRVMSLRDGTKKMSKSDESDYSRLVMTDDADAIALKIRKAKTDPLPMPETAEEAGNRPEAANLIQIFAALSNRTKPDVIAAYAGKSFSDFKKDLADLCVSVLGPIGAEMKRLMSDPAEIDRVLKLGTERARAIAEPILAETKALMGLPALPK